MIRYRFTLYLLLLSYGCGDQTASSVADDSVNPEVMDDSAEDASIVQSEPDRSKPGDRFRHPLQNAPIFDGLVAGVDIHDDPLTGERFAVGESTWQFEGQAMPTTDSGVVRVRISEADPEFLAAKTSNTSDSLTINPSPDPLGAELRRLMNEGELANQSTWVRIRITDDFQAEHIFTGLERAIGLGRIQSNADFLAERQRLMEVRRLGKALRRQALVTELEAGAIEYHNYENLNLMKVLADESVINWLVSRDDVHSVRLVTERGEDSSCPVIPASWLGSSLDAVEVSHGTQIQQFFCDFHNGGNGGNGSLFSTVRAAVIEDGVTDLTLGRYSGSGRTGNRLIDRRGCGLFYCNAADFGDETGHATRTTNLLMGDLRRDQDPNVSTDIMQLTNSGYAPSVEVVSLALENGSASFETAADEVLGFSKAADIVNVSWGMDSSTIAFDCNGDWDEDEAVNELFESGTLVFKSAGNDGSKGCNISVPGSAIGAFTVGGTGDRFSQADVVTNQVINGPMYLFSSAGDGYGRTIVDIVAPAYRRNMFGFMNADGSGNYTESGAGTSYATPTVTAAAANFIDFYVSHFSSWINHPGALFSQMLLMGDRFAGTTGGARSTRFDTWSGAGRMKMRKFDSPGMDTPWFYGRYSVCVDHNTTVSYLLPNVSSDVESLRVVAYWYDRRHDASFQVLDDIDLRVDVTNASGQTTRRYSQDYHDEKEAIYFDLSSYGQVDVSIHLTGFDVTSDNEGCGSNSMRVFLGYYYEDTDRDDADGPGGEIDTL